MISAVETSREGVVVPTQNLLVVDLRQGKIVSMREYIWDADRYATLWRPPVQRPAGEPDDGSTERRVAVPV
ncbi:MAG: hypothetical protein ACXWNG_05520 [Candidatus Limnocylindrales bacterium]